MIPYKSTLSGQKKSSYAIEGEEFNKGLASDSSSTLSNIFKSNSIKFIRIFGIILFFLTFLLLSNMFSIMHFHMNRIRRKIEFLRNGYLILNCMLYTKFYITEGVLAKAFKYN